MDDCDMMFTLSNGALRKRLEGLDLPNLHGPVLALPICGAESVWKYFLQPFA